MNVMIAQLKVCIFDLDGVIVDTAKYHYLAWKRMANDLGFDFSEAENEKLKGVSRVESLRRILEWGNLELDEVEQVAWAKQKNDWYLEYVANMTEAEILPGVLSLFDDIKAAGVKIVLGSASKNARLILDKVNLLSSFDFVVDGTMVTNSKPDPEVFLKGAEAVGADPKECIVFEDAAEGVKAALRGGMYAVGVGDYVVLNRANLTTDALNHISFKEILECLNMRV
ncbi:MAG: beta-phosphoglucomutase [Bacteroidota bacterium]|jgi:beta-phosphoglucomutase